jgi:hypothetical protein
MTDNQVVRKYTCKIAQNICFVYGLMHYFVSNKQKQTMETRLFDNDIKNLDDGDKVWNVSGVKNDMIQFIAYYKGRELEFLVPFDKYHNLVNSGFRELAYPKTKRDY